MSPASQRAICTLAISRSNLPSHVRSRQVRTKWTAAEGMATLEAMSSHHNFRPGRQNKLVSEPPIAAPDEHAQLVEADQRFQAALGQAIAAGHLSSLSDARQALLSAAADPQINRRRATPQGRRDMSPPHEIVRLGMVYL